MAVRVVPLSDKVAKAMVQCCCHLGGVTSSTSLKEYIFGKREEDKVNIIDIKKMWEKLNLAARMICSIPNPKDIVVVSSKDFGRKAVIKFAESIGATAVTGRFIPGSFSNYEIKGVREPRLVLVSDCFADKQVVKEASYVNAPCIAFCNTDNDIEFVDMVIPMNNRSQSAIGAGFCILSKLVNYMKGNIDKVEDKLRDHIELYTYRDSDELEQLYQEQKIEEEADMVLKDESDE
ncbi:40S ribosomal protein S0 [Spraguea lophii 42_110]|uniref:Small ribosomal subunit protein uS2 n=1 Tax=Spraguea lophii (strain 42_110) TaxID=1358809 RepID=S7W8R1_SPRLO|nr:Chain SA0, 40S ribosomal protein S0 [Spraguea lophii 42_110]7QJH_RA0 Chain RA0, 40S ribosomal protein S0 [Spraguea lophii 42_110]7QJH_SA0 Chain SA0, 40S ribosomal protein S0 [Spraguea lophii 42_110]8BR3_SA0 Chain SA0, 40S ribosomal protein S0 [Spraguea lophii 42_110]8P5D_SA0 Chain SA0, 40S ribosomal protein S0 [Spraguea lophii 42_110]8P60_RA0 Chain RA0, 40S ribosomal protein S0 [Spraguea lophii 42_110]8P60_SA0 Chain SA0, 40S ribosomal protein S0 [Spraguea lophii 42_110]EPR79270.1 40S ribo